MYGGSSDGDGHKAATQRKIPPVRRCFGPQNLPRYIGTGAGLGSEALMSTYVGVSDMLLMIVFLAGKATVSRD
ncbi:hypothetical protein Gohar_011861 [Gossypium harknessii]|uniref:Uncharacterized protein n=1 Tax=Gossypium harknessii TaxID=34285 RepID=A0A7J9GV85_9ROSI|nr:hypothetical protein [Gossypium harknessii]